MDRRLPRPRRRRNRWQRSSPPRPRPPQRSTPLLPPVQRPRWPSPPTRPSRPGMAVRITGSFAPSRTTASRSSWTVTPCPPTTWCARATMWPWSTSPARSSSDSTCRPPGRRSTAIRPRRPRATAWPTARSSRRRRRCSAVGSKRCLPERWRTCTRSTPSPRAASAPTWRTSFPTCRLPRQASWRMTSSSWSTARTMLRRKQSAPSSALPRRATPSRSPWCARASCAMRS